MIVSDLEKKFKHRLDLRVRDAEVYLGGVVHNSTYLDYLEHGRNTYLREHNLDFEVLYRTRDIKFTQASGSQVYKKALKSNDTFYVLTRVERASTLQFRYVQSIVKSPENEVCMEAITMGVLIGAKGMPIRVPEDIDVIMTSLGAGRDMIIPG